MAARKTVAQRPRARKSRVSEILAANPNLAVTPRQGVITLQGYGIQVRVDRGHLILEDGIGADRRYARLARVGHGLNRLVTIGPDGLVSLAALRWLASQEASFVMLDRSGSVLLATGPARRGDVHLRRAQALARQSGVGVEITHDLIRKKLAGQEKVVRNQLRDPAAADAIARIRADVPSLSSFDAIRLYESQAGAIYWGAWRNVEIQFPRQDLPRVPEHWRMFNRRKSPITRTPRLAANPANAMLNYVYAIVEAEARLAAATMGLDPAMGFLHADSTHRDSLAADLMEPVRPEVDAFVLDWILHEPLKRAWFFEQHDGNCRLMAPFAARLSETAETWRKFIAPVAESVARTLRSEVPKHAQYKPLPTRLTQQRRRDARGRVFESEVVKTKKTYGVCRTCGVSISPGRKYCPACHKSFSSENLTRVAKLRRLVPKTPETAAKISASQTRHGAAKANWDPASLPGWLNQETYLAKVAPLLTRLSRTLIMSTLEVGRAYATNIARANVIPHPRHWVKLAELAGIAD